VSKFRIHSHLFLISDPFRVGHSLTDSEARALNALRSENIRNNLAKELKKLPLPLSPAALEAFEKRVAEYDAAYCFYPHLKDEPSSASPLEREIQAVAKEWNLPLDHPDVHSEARARLDLERKVSQRVLQELGG
jgi:hypothetical protein